MRPLLVLTRLARALLPTASAAALLAACAVPGQRDADLQALRQGPGNLPQKNITDFTAALRCMDDTLMAFGTRDIVVLIEELQDQTRRLGAGTRDMMVSAFSDMTRRSRAIRLVTFGLDNQNVVLLLQQLEKRTPFGVLPQYDIRGSVTQFDEDVLRRDVSAGAALPAVFSGSASRSTQFNVLGFDASVISVPDLTLVPGVTSKNTVIVARDERALNDGNATIQKLGLSFNLRVARAAGTAQALRSMVELASIELVGKLTRVPYWTCLGASKDSPEIRREIEDWFFSLRDETERNKFFQEQLRNRRFYDGAVDGRSSIVLDRALRAYKRGLGLPDNAAIDVGFFGDFLSQPVPPAPATPFKMPEAESKVIDLGATGSTAQSPDAAGASNPRATPRASAPSSTPNTGVTAGARADGAPPAQNPGPAPRARAGAPGTGASVTISTLQASYRVNEAVEFGVETSRAGYLYCYVQPASGGAIQRVFPNREMRDPRVEANQMLLLPGGRGFRITSARPGTLKLACLAAPREIYNDLPPPLRWGDFEDIGLPSFDAIRQAFERTGKQPVVMDAISVKFE